MFCPNCGNNCGNANFCPNCGQKLTVQEAPPVKQPAKAAPRSMYNASVNGREINMLKIVSKYGGNTSRACTHLRREYGLTKEEAQELLAPFISQTKANSTPVTFKSMMKEYSQEVAEKVQEEAQLRKNLEASGQIYCPQCLSTSVSSHKKGFGIGKAVIGANLFGGIGLAAGNIGAQKVLCTCLKCGNQWQAGKK